MQKYFKKSGSFALRSISKHSAQLAGLVVEAGSLEPLVKCLEDFDVTVKEAAAFALAYIATHTEGKHASLVAPVPCCRRGVTSCQRPDFHVACVAADLANAVVEAGAVPLLVLSVQEPEVGLRRVCASALSDISKHSQQVGEGAGRARRL